MTTGAENKSNRTQTLSISARRLESGRVTIRLDNARQGKVS